MLKVNHLKQISIIILTASIIACATTPKEEQENVVTTQASDDGKVETTDLPNSGSLTKAEEKAKTQAEAKVDTEKLTKMKNAELKKLLKNKVFYFEFDQYFVYKKDELTVRAHGLYLSNHANAKVRIDGHTDERGTREYNVALGERRGKSVKQLLLSSGAQNKQIEVVSFGEEKPKMQGHDEAAYSQNRRVEIVYTTGRPK